MTERRDTEREQVKEARELLAAIVETSGDAIISRTLDGTVLSWNAGAEKMFGYRAAEMIGRSISRIAPPERQHESHHNTWLLQHGRPVPSFETVRIARDGRPVHVQISVSAIRDGAGNATRVAAIFRDIGKSRQAEQARANLAAIVENANDAIISRALDGTILTWNKGAERLLGYTAAEAVGRPVTFILPPGRQSRMARNTETVLNGGTIAPHETQRMTKDGRVIDVLVSLSPIRDGAGKVSGASVIFHDISALTRAEAAAKESDERFRAAFEQAGVGMGLRSIDPRQPHWLRVNQKLCDILGYTREELLELSSVDVTPPEERQTAIDFNEKLLRGEVASYSREKRYVRKDGRIIWANINLTAVNGPDGRPAHVISVIQDITERMEAEKHARLSAAVLENSNEGIIVTDASNSIISVNPAFTRITGYAPAEVIGKSPSLLSSGIQDKAFYQALWASIHATGRWQGELWDRRKNGEIYCERLSISTVKNPQGETVYHTAIFTDITERKRAERELQRKAALTQLLESLARAVNEAATSEQAMQACLERICDYGGWTLARVGTFAPGQRQGAPQSSLWHCRQPAHFDGFIGISNRYSYSGRTSGQFVSAALRERKPVWVSDFSTTPGFGRLAEAVKCGIRAGFVFPVVVGDEALAFFEFFADEVRAPDALFLEAIATIASQLARVIERSHARNALRESEHLMRLVTEHTPAMIAYFDAELICRFANNAYCQFHHVDPQGVIGMSLRDITGEDTYRVISPTLAHVKNGKPVTLRREERAENGEIRHIEIHRVPDMSPAGAFRGYYAMVLDITERVRAEESRANLAAIVESSNDAIVGRSLEHRITSWNAAAERLFGYSAAEVIGRDIALIIPPECEAEAARNRALLAQGRVVHDLETVRLARGGRRIDVALTQSPIRDERGAVVGVSLTFRDLAERKRAERELQRKAALTQLLESLARAANEAVTPEQAMQACLERICEHGGWTLGRVAIFAPGQPLRTPQQSIWRCRDPAPYADFVQRSEGFDYSIQTGRFVAKALREQRPVWIEDLAVNAPGTRLPAAVKAGLRAGFAFPVSVNGNVAAFLEFFADETRAPDAQFLEAASTIGSQLARVIERKRALDEARASEQKLDSILDALHEVVWSMDLKSGRLLYLNAAARRLARRPVSDFLADARLWRRMIHREDRAQVLGSARKLLADGNLTHEFRIVLADGEARVVESRAHVVRDAEGGVQRIDGTMTDITERKQAEARSDYLAQHDTVTALPNRRLFNDRLTLALARDKRLGAMTALLLLDLDRFKQINESLGHGAGDLVLQTVSARLKERLREVDTIARLGGDEFAVILEGVTGKEQALHVAEKIVEAMAEPLQIGGEEIFVTASVGVTTSPDDADSVENLIENAELAMYQAKQDGRNTLHAYVPDKKPRRSTGLGLESKLRRAIERDELLLHFQPKVDIRSGAVAGAEALVRWRNPELGLVPPLDFIPLAEETGLIVPIGEWVLHSACTQASAWRRQGYPLAVAVNLSARQFRQKNLCDMVALALADSGLPAESLELEITESMIMHRVEQAIVTLRQLHELGVKLSVDDFGTGYSSLSYLKRFPVHNLKIDRSFVRDLHQNADDAAIVRAVIALAQNMHLRTVAEGVETEQQLIFLAGLQCDEYQGYYFSKPLPAVEFLSLLQAQHAAPVLSACANA